MSGSLGGVILGTAPYMSPEQARGKTVDTRTDVWAFGCVLYEMLTGRRAFAGETTTDILAKVLEGQPRWEALPAGVPGPIRMLLEAALSKDPEDRLQHIDDARVFLNRSSVLVEKPPTTVVDDRARRRGAAAPPPPPALPSPPAACAGGSVTHLPAKPDWAYAAVEIRQRTATATAKRFFIQASLGYVIRPNTIKPAEIDIIGQHVLGSLAEAFSGARECRSRDAHHRRLVHDGVLIVMRRPAMHRALRSRPARRIHRVAAARRPLRLWISRES
jgi:protein kinase-like protein